MQSRQVVELGLEYRASSVQSSSSFTILCCFPAENANELQRVGRGQVEAAGLRISQASLQGLKDCPAALQELWVGL